MQKWTALLPEKLSRLGPFHEFLVAENGVLESCFGVLFVQAGNFMHYKVPSGWSISQSNHRTIDFLLGWSMRRTQAASVK